MEFLLLEHSARQMSRIMRTANIHLGALCLSLSVFVCCLCPCCLQLMVERPMEAQKKNDCRRGRAKAKAKRLLLLQQV